jgi:hypothetical protein
MRPLKIPMSVAMTHRPLVTFSAAGPTRFNENRSVAVAAQTLPPHASVTRTAIFAQFRPATKEFSPRRRYIRHAYKATSARLQRAAANSPDMHSFSSRSNTPGVAAVSSRGALRQRRETL